jgi:hypothetical protein
MNKGIEIVTGKWISDSLKAGKLLPTSDYPVLTDKNVNISDISRSGKKSLAGKEVWITSAVRPVAKEWKEAITTAGGTLLHKRPKKPSGNVIIIATSGKSDVKDRAEFRGLGFKVHDAEYLLAGMLTHKFPADRVIKS